MRIINYIFFVIVLSTIIWGCKKPYNPLVITGNNNYLVVEGLINTGNDSTFFKLSRTVKLSEKNTLRPEMNAIVSVESDQNLSYQLQEAGIGVYSSASLNLPGNTKYRLRIKSQDGKEYLSDFVEAKDTPAIDSISYKEQNNGLQFYVNSHDPKNNTRYYRWDFNETWKYVSLYRSSYKYENSYPVYRLPNIYPDDNIYECYKTEVSQQILLGSSAKLGQDVIYMQPVNFITAGSGKISFGYSVFLRQYALTLDGFTYWQNLKKNTEQLGSVFDAQPSSLQGNIHCLNNPSEPVLGYVSASNIKSKRIFIDHNTINLFTPYYIAPPDADACPGKTIAVAPAASFQYRLNQTFGSGDTVLISSISPPGIPIITGYSYAAKECVDCRVKSPYGTNIKPAYWP